MGLDMYLSASRYVSGWDHQKTDEKEKYEKILNAVGAVPFREFPSLTVSVKVGYWRKANAIHQWFVDNVQDGEDDCKEYYVSREQLEELKSLCERVLVDPTEEGPEFLPTQDGFFFGSTDYGDGYIQDLKDTVRIITEALEKYDESWEFDYRSSW